MKMKFLPLLASLMFVTACGQTNASQSQAPAQDPSSATQQSQQVQEEYKLTFLQNAEIYIDFNFTNAPAGLAIKIGETTLTASGKATMTKDFTFEVQGTFTNKINIYHVIDTGTARSAGKGEGMDAAVAKERIERYISNFSSKQYEYRIYFCLSDKANGWSTTLPGVDEAIKEYTGNILG